MLVLCLIGILILFAGVGLFASWQTNHHNVATFRNATKTAAQQGLLYAEAIREAPKNTSVTISTLIGQNLLPNGFSPKTPYGRTWEVFGLRQYGSSAWLIMTQGMPTRAGQGVALTQTGAKLLSWKVANKVWRMESDPMMIVGVIPRNSACIDTMTGTYKVYVAGVASAPYARTAIYFGPVVSQSNSFC